MIQIVSQACLPEAQPLSATRLIPGQQCTHSQHQKLNTWDQVEDFNWLHADQNPHWTVIAARDRISNELWQDASNGKNDRQTLCKILMASIRQTQNMEESLIPSE